MRGKLTLTLDAAFRAEKLVVTPGAEWKKPRIGIQRRGQQRGKSLARKHDHRAVCSRGVADADRRSGKRFAAHGGLEKRPTISSRSTGAMDVWPKVNQPRELNLKGNVQLKTQADTSGEARGRCRRTNCAWNLPMEKRRRQQARASGDPERVEASNVRMRRDKVERREFPRAAMPREQNGTRISSKWNSVPRGKAKKVDCDRQCLDGAGRWWHPVQTATAAERDGATTG